MALSIDRTVKIIGFGLAIAVFLDVFMVRMAIAPDGQPGQGAAPWAEGGSPNSRRIASNPYASWATSRSAATSAVKPEAA